MSNITKYLTDENSKDDALMPLSRSNFYLMIAAGVVIVIGFLLMLGSGSSTENGFNADIFSTRRIVVGPAIAFLGFLFMGFAIIWRGRKN